VLVGGCGSSSAKSAPTTSTQPPTPAAQAQQLINQACIQYARTILSTDPNSGIPQMTATAAATAYTQAEHTAAAAAKLDPRWKPADKALLHLSQALALQSNSGMRTALPEVHAACDPVIAKLATPTTIG
jgi:hypothetical protein